MGNWDAGAVNKGNKFWAGIVHSALALVGFWEPHGTCLTPHPRGSWHSQQPSALPLNSGFISSSLYLWDQRGTAGKETDTGPANTPKTQESLHGTGV